MIIEEIYYNASGIARWNLGWPTPTYAGAFIATLLPFSWYLSGIFHCALSRLRLAHLIFSSTFEAIGWYLLAKTQSRGALVAALVSILCWHLLIKTKTDPQLRAIRFIMIAACIFFANFFQRIAPSFILHDKSAENRIEVWRAGLEMFAASPTHGWGSGASGLSYENWFQDLTHSEVHDTPVNSYLYICAERGWLASVAIGFILIFPLIGVLQTSFDPQMDNHRRLALLTGGLSLLTWDIASFFSTLWIEPRLWIVPLIAFTLIFFIAARFLLKPKPLLYSLFAASSTVLFAYTLGYWLLSREVLRPFCLSRGITEIIRPHDHQAKTTWHVWPDNVVLGPFPGKQIREWLELPHVPSTTIIHFPFLLSDYTPRDSDNIMLFGRQVQRLTGELSGRYTNVFIIHPDGYPPNPNIFYGKTPSRIVVILPEIDEVGNRKAWLAWIGGVHARLLISPGVGQDIRLAWPFVLRDFDFQ